MSEVFDLVVIGGGPGGYVAAIRAAQLGQTVALVEKEQLGGTCLNRGCIPTKALVKAANLWREINSCQEFGFSVSAPKLDMAAVQTRKNQVVAALRSGVETLMKGNKIKVYHGRAEVAEAGRVRVQPDTGEAVVLEARNLILAHGSAPARVPIPGADLPGVITSDEALDLDSVPGRMVIIGGGVIGIEFAGIFASFGTEITVVEILPAILPMVDEEISRRLTPLLKKAGIAVRTRTRVEAIQQKGDGLAVEIEGAAGKEVLAADLVLLATGRVPVTDGIDIEALGLRMNGRAVAVDERMRTSVPGIYAIGDLVGGAMLAHVASAEGIVAAENCAGLEATMDYRVVPSCIFCEPEVASVGLTEKEAREQGIDVKVSKFPFSANGKALTLGAPNGIVKLIGDAQTGLVLGGHIMGPHATDLIAEVALAIKARVTAADIAHTIHAHPTLAETVAEAAHGLVGKPLHQV